MSFQENCRLCKTNLMVKGVVSNSRNLFTLNSLENPLHKRFRDIGVFLPKRYGVFSRKICGKCYRKLVRVETALKFLKKWQKTAETEATVEKELQRATQQRYMAQDNDGSASIIFRHVASQTDPAEKRSIGTQLKNVKNRGTQAKIPSRDCGVCTLTYPLDSSVLFLQPTKVKRPSKRPSKRPRLSLTNGEEGPSDSSSFMVDHEPEDSV
ncbi:uncharacterized protein LOC121945486 [Plectropomus leopardus]|uniref:uncharacterized protein LOC121945486 n=1 Tax=Plectropomus leopardus TaxID=160734 RepID=UPI001C4B4661|nr:uncharacterized protein LOC121945486 [Plectropomus leopardus]